MAGKKKDLTGQVFGRLTVVRFAEIRGKRTLWLCLCSCGKEAAVRADALKDGNTRSCGCLHQDVIPSYQTEQGPVSDLTGMEFGRLTVLREVEKTGKHRLWECRCSCGEIKVISGRSIVSGHCQSCGCLQRDKAAAQAVTMGAGNCTHGRTHTREYETWHHMRQRCFDPNNPSFEHYGEKGVAVCERWSIFENFFADMGLKPSPAHQIDRIDPTGNYEPGNCRWVTPKEQQRNRRQHVMLTHEGRTMCLSAWAEEKGLTTQHLWARLFKCGWTLKEALDIPLRPRRKKADVNSKEIS